VTREYLAHMDGKQACLGSLLLAGSGAILAVSGAAGGRLLVAAGALAFALAAATSIREARAGQAV